MGLTNCGNFNSIQSGEFLLSDSGKSCTPGAPMITTRSTGHVPFVGTPDFMAAIMQGDGNFVVYYVERHTIGSDNLHAKWAANGGSFGGPGSAHQGPFKLSLNDDGILTITDGSGVQMWQSTLSQPATQKPCRLVMQDDCNLVVYDAAGKALWASNTAGQDHP